MTTSTTTTTTTAAPTTTTSTTTTTTTTVPGCVEYIIQNNTENIIAVGWYSCFGTLIGENILQNQQTTFCADVSYGAINTDGGDLTTVGGCPCISYTLTNPDSEITSDYEYINCSGTLTTGTIPPTQNVTICAKQGEVRSTGGDYTLQDNGPC
jgi:hypothetical protein